MSPFPSRALLVCLLSGMLGGCDEAAEPARNAPPELEEVGNTSWEAADWVLQEVEVPEEPHCREGDNRFGPGTSHEVPGDWFSMPESLGNGFVEITGQILDPGRVEFDPWNGQLGDPSDLTTGIFADLDGDGMAEVLISSEGSCHSGSCPMVFRYHTESGELHHAPEMEDLLPGLDNGAIIGFLDLTGDGKEDHLLGFTHTLAAIQGEKNTHKERIEIPVPEGYPFDDFRDTGALALADLDENGLIDIVEGDSTCQGGGANYQVALQVTPGRFEAAGPGLLGASPPTRSDAILATPLGPEGEFLIQLLGETCDKTEPHTGFMRRSGWDEEGYPLFEMFEPFDESAHFKSFPLVSYGPYSLIHPMGGTLGDLNLDGRWDSISTYSPPPLNGWEQKRAVFGIFGSAEAWPLEDWSPFSSAGPHLGEQNLHQIPWANALIDFNGDGAVDLLTTHGADWDGLQMDSRWVGMQDVTLHLARGPHCFEDATALSGIQQPGNWRSLTVGDLEGDGDADIIVGGFGELPRVYRNEIETGNHHLALRLRGHTSNRLGVGAVVRVEAEQAIVGQPQYAGHIGSPFAVSEPLVFAGLGPATHAKKVTIEWPSGVIQVVENLSAGRIHRIEEYPLIEVIPFHRRVEVGHQAIVWVTPRTEKGDLNLDVEVEAEVFAGKASIQDIVGSEDGFRVHLSGPPDGGNAVIEVRLDGKPVGVRPRIVWE